MLMDERTDREDLERNVMLRDGTSVRLRPIRPDDDAGLVEDAWQGQGLGTILLHAIMRAGESRGIRTFRVDVLSENRRMLQLLARETEIVSRTASQGVTEALVQVRR